MIFFKKVYEAHVRGLLAEGETPGEWRLVGYVAAEGDDAAAALQVRATVAEIGIL